MLTLMVRRHGYHAARKLLLKHGAERLSEVPTDRLEGFEIELVKTLDIKERLETVATEFDEE